jgi:hypothetical protein
LLSININNSAKSINLDANFLNFLRGLIMKYTKIALACGLAFAAMSAQADLVPGAAAVAETNIIYMAGATAPDNFLAGVAPQLFSGTPIEVRPLTGALDDFRAFVGTSNGVAAGYPAGQPLMFIKRSLGGSVWGVSPVATGDIIQTLDVKSANCVAPIPGSAALTAGSYWRCPVIGTDPQGTINGANGRIPDIGISDIEPAMFKEPFNTENGAPQLSNAQLAALVSLPVNQLMMGIVATNAVAATTSIGRSQYGAALAGKLTNWSQIDGSPTSGTGLSRMVVCRRVNGSGTQTSYNWFFSGFPCNSSTLGYLSTPPAPTTASPGLDTDNFAGTVAEPFEIDPTAGITIVENSTSGAVRACLSSAYYGLDHTVQGNTGTFYKVLFSQVDGTPVSASFNPVPATGPAFTGARGGPSKAIGVLSVDSANNANSNFTYAPINSTGTAPASWSVVDNTAGKLSNSGWSFRMLDGAGVYNAQTQAVTFPATGATGVAPSKENMVNGRYDFVVELTLQRRASIPAAKLSFFNALRTRLGDAANNTGVAVAALPDLYSYTNPAVNALRVSKYSREGNTCAPLVRFPSLP